MWRVGNEDALKLCKDIVEILPVVPDIQFQTPHQHRIYHGHILGLINHYSVEKPSARPCPLVQIFGLVFLPRPAIITMIQPRSELVTSKWRTDGGIGIQTTVTFSTVR